MAGSHTLRPAAALAAAATAATVLLGPAPVAAGRPRPADPEPSAHPAPSTHPHLLSLPSNAAKTGTVAALNTAGDVLGGVPPEGGYAQ
ncbi:hypothetical protein ACFVX9_37195 [Kitasatospora sp. NPDC058243]|uniref:hypothetical protein n=1 Tax=Kitasatospora sp. NPDC058243 TaxID=3346397 RepID=UPI0036DB7416